MKTVESLGKIVMLSDLRGEISLVRLTSKSLVRDMFWEFERRNQPRSIVASKLKVDWRVYPFQASFIGELQRIFALYWFAPKHFGARAAQMKPNTFCAVVKSTLAFLKAVVLSMPSPNLISSLSQLKAIDLISLKFTSGSAEEIKRGLKVLFHPNSAKLVEDGLNIRSSDIDGMDFCKWDKVDPEAEPVYLSDELFTLLSDASVARTQDFLRRMCLPIEDRESGQSYQPVASICRISSFEKLFAVYETYRRGCKKLPGGDVNAAYQFKKSGVTLGNMNDYLIEVNDSAQTIIALYTGGRHSELASFECGCLVELDGVHCIKGTVFKTKSDIELIDDSWVAIPAVRDAVRVLEALASIKSKAALFTSMETASGIGLKGSGMAYTGGGLVGMLRRHLSRIDLKGKYINWKFNTHQFKHSLTRQMIKVKLGLPYISFQLKHLHSRVSSLPSDVTLKYGNAAKLLQSEMAGLQLGEIKRSIAKKIFDPDSRIAGGGAAAFDEKRKTYFAGMIAAGYTKEQIIESLAASEVEVLVNVGLGYCSGKKKIGPNGANPPCIGCLKCNPKQCGNAVVTEEHAPAWKAVYLENTKLASDPRFFYGKEEFRAAADEACMVLSELGMDASE